MKTMYRHGPMPASPRKIKKSRHACRLILGILPPTPAADRYTLQPGPSGQERKTPAMRSLEYRKPRTPAVFPIDFTIDGETVPGTCRNVSDTGICGEFHQTLKPGTFGILTLYHPTHTRKVEARIAHTERTLAGLTFIYDSPQQRGLTTRFMASLTTRPT